VVNATYGYFQYLFANNASFQSILLNGSPLSITSNVTVTTVPGELTSTLTTPTNVQLGLADYGTPGTCAYPVSVSFDSKGRGQCMPGSAPVSAVTASNGLSSSGGTTPDISMDNVGTAGTYAYPSSVTTNARGQLTSVTPGPAPLFSLTPGPGIFVSGSTISNNGVPITPLDSLDASLRALVISNSNYASNATAVAAVRASLQACMGKSCLLAPGFYYIDSPLVIAQYTHFIGSGPLSTFVFGTNSSAPVFTGNGGYNVFRGLTVGNALCSNAFYVAAPSAIYATTFTDMFMIGGTSDAFNVLNEFQLTFTNVNFQTLGNGNGCVSTGNKGLWISCAFGPFGSTSAIAIKTLVGGTFINLNGLYGNNFAAKYAEFGDTGSGYPTATFIGCNLEGARITSISLLIAPSYVRLIDCVIQTTAPGSTPRSIIDNLDAAPAAVLAQLSVSLEGTHFFLTSFNSTANPTGAMVITQSSSAPTGMRYVSGDIGATGDNYILVQTGGTGSNTAYRLYNSGVSTQVTANGFPTSAGPNRALTAYVPLSYAAYSFAGQLSFLVTTLAASTTAISFSTTAPLTRASAFKTANTVATSLARCSPDSYVLEGTMMHIIIGDSFTTILHNTATQSSPFFLKSGTNETTTRGNVYQFMFLPSATLSPLGGWIQT
jgi:hypothetical protein